MSKTVGIGHQNFADLSRSMCDFGKGFYMGDIPEQPIGLIAGWKNHKLYEMEFQADGLHVKNLEIPMKSSSIGLCLLHITETLNGMRTRKN